LPIIYIALGIIGTISTMVALAQVFGLQPWPTFNNATSGLFFNPISTGGFLALTLVALATAGFWEFFPILLLGLYLTHSRGGWAVLVFGLIAIWFRRPLWLLVGILALALVFTTSFSASDSERIRIWHAAVLYLSPFGNGFDSFSKVLIQHNGVWAWPEYAHNDYLQLAFEFGIFAIPVYALVLWVLAQTSANEWPIFAAFAFMACFTMPLHIPAVAAIGALALISITARRLLDA
jgi:hypothetical protein